MRNIRRAALATILAVIGVHASASLQAQSVPGAGHGFLIDKHSAANVKCASCHTTSRARPPTTATCLGCHGGSYDALAVRTATHEPNPHQSHQGEVPCAACHHVHKASENSCVQCHANFSFEVP